MNGNAYLRCKSYCKKARRRKNWICVLAVLLCAVICCGLLVIPVFFPSTALNTSAKIEAVPSPALQSAGSWYVEPEATAEPTPEPNAEIGEIDADEGEQVVKLTDTGEGDEIVNILLIGIDEEYKDYSADCHTDTMIVVAVNFTKGTADLISLRRDTLCHVPGAYGIYKLNGAFNVGGGLYADNYAGFLKTCQAAEYMLGGIPVNYFYAVQLPALIEIVDLIGGVDYNVDITYGDLKRGWQHLDGEDVMVYVRARKEMVSGTEGDINRVYRQKQMLLAIFNKLKTQNMLTLLPDLVSTVERGFFTNTSMTQTLALLNFASKLDTSSIRTYSLDGPMHMVLGWAFCTPDDEIRAAAIREVYGIEVEPLIHCSYKYARWLEDIGMKAMKYLANADKVGSFAEAEWANSVEMAQLTAAYTAAKAAYNTASYSFADADTRTLESVMRALRSAVEELAEVSGYDRNLHWTPLPDWTNDPDINEVYVDFR